MHRIARLTVAALSFATLLGGLLLGSGAMATPAGASTTIGQTGADSARGCFGGTVNSLVQVSTGSGVPSYVVPSGINEITSWSAQGSFTNSLMALEIWRPTTTPGSYVLVGISPAETIVNTLNTFTLASPISVQAGDVLGQGSSALSDFCFVTDSGPAGDVVGLAALGSTSPGTTVAFTDVPFAGELNMAAYRDLSDPTPNHHHVSARGHCRSALLLSAPGQRGNPALHLEQVRAREAEVFYRGGSAFQRAVSSRARLRGRERTRSSSSVCKRQHSTRTRRRRHRNSRSPSIRKGLIHEPGCAVHGRLAVGKHPSLDNRPEPGVIGGTFHASRLDLSFSR